MLQTLSIKNVALITNLSIEFSKGFNVLLGETGAGKSIIFDALNFVLGEKADKSLIRSGETEMRVDAVFSELSQNTQDALTELGFEGEELIISRSLSIDGKNTIRINGLPSILTILKNVGQLLIDSYSQHENIELLKPKNHLSLLDKFGGEQIENAKIEVYEILERQKSIINQIKELGGNEFERERTKSLLEFQIEEIENAKLSVGEDEQLQEKLKFMQSAEKIFEAVSICEDLLSGSSSSCTNSLQQASSALSSLSSFEELFDCKTRLDSVRYEIEDINETLCDIKSNTEYDEREYERLDRRLDTIKSICKKYGGTIDNALEHLRDAKEKYLKLEDSNFLLNKLEKEKGEILKELEIACNKLTFLRQRTAKEIQQKILTELQQLGMKSSNFEIQITPLSEACSTGKDSVEFIFSANKGQELKSLSKTASGGELSRFMLAVKNVFASLGTAQTLIFDEIDSGISGEVGKVVGNKINNISKQNQVLCITHLPQVACHADSMYFVSKKETESSTQTEIKLLQGEEILLSLAKMVVGNEVSETSLNQAKEMRINAGKTV